MIPVLLALLTIPTPDGPIAEVGRLAPTIREASGIVASRRHPGIFWVHSDSGNPPDLFAVRRDGALVRKYRIGVPNIDWEDITIDDDGRLYIGDTGNNAHRLSLRMIYRIDEPDPSSPDPGDEPLKVARAWFYRFEGLEGRFDAESLVRFDGQFVVISKRRDGKAAELFAVPIEPSAPLTRPVIPTRIGTLPGCVDPVTSASFDEKRGLLAVLTYKHVRIYRKSEQKEWVEQAVIAHPLPGAEGITWDGRDLLLVDEDHRMVRIEPRAWSDGARKP